MQMLYPYRYSGLPPENQSPSIPEIKAEKQISSTLTDIIKLMAYTCKMPFSGTLKESEIKYYKYPREVNPVATLENIPRLGSKRLCELYKDISFLHLTGGLELHRYFLKIFLLTEKKSKIVNCRIVSIRDFVMCR